MVRRLREAAVPAYLLLCLMLGGSGQGVWTNMMLQLLGLGLIAWAAVRRADEPIAQDQRQLLWLALIALAIVAAQLVPLAAHRYGRASERGSRLPRAIASSESPRRRCPLSVAPYQSLSSLLSLIPALAMLLRAGDCGRARRCW